MTIASSVLNKNHLCCGSLDFAYDGAERLQEPEDREGDCVMESSEKDTVVELTDSQNLQGCILVFTGMDSTLQLDNGQLTDSGTRMSLT